MARVIVIDRLGRKYLLLESFYNDLKKRVCRVRSLLSGVHRDFFAGDLTLVSIEPLKWTYRGE
jgi:hypothetical protein